MGPLLGPPRVCRVLYLLQPAARRAAQRHLQRPVKSPIKPNRAKKKNFRSGGRRVNHAELKLPSLVKLCSLVRRVFWPEAGILVRLQSLGVAIPVLGRVRSGRYKAKYRYFTSLEIAPEGGLG
jgi:hypothetical protein